MVHWFLVWAKVVSMGMTPPRALIDMGDHTIMIYIVALESMLVFMRLVIIHHIFSLRPSLAMINMGLLLQEKQWVILEYLHTIR
jgi:hypothetical protein